MSGSAAIWPTRAGSSRGRWRDWTRIDGVRVLAVSPSYITAPIGGGPQPDYVNAVALVRRRLRRARCSIACSESSGCTAAAASRTRLATRRERSISICYYTARAGCARRN